MRLSAAALMALALVVCASALPASAVVHGSEQGIVYSPATLPVAMVGTKYAVTMTAKYATINGGGYASLSTQTTLTTSSEAAPGILFRTGKVPGGSSLILSGNPTVSGMFHFTTCVVLSDGSCDPKQWTLSVNGEVKKATPGWVTRAENAKLDLEQALRDESSAESLITDDKFAAAKPLLDRALQRLEGAQTTLKLVADLVPSATAGTQARYAATNSGDAAAEDRAALKDAQLADTETGDKEQFAKKEALTDLHFATRRKDIGIEEARSVLATAP